MFRCKIYGGKALLALGRHWLAFHHLRLMGYLHRKTKAGSIEDCPEETPSLWMPVFISAIWWSKEPKRSQTKKYSNKSFLIWDQWPETSRKRLKTPEEETWKKIPLMAPAERACGFGWQDKKGNSLLHDVFQGEVQAGLFQKERSRGGVTLEKGRVVWGWVAWEEMIRNVQFCLKINHNTTKTSLKWVWLHQTNIPHAGRVFQFRNLPCLWEGEAVPSARRVADYGVQRKDHVSDAGARGGGVALLGRWGWEDGWDGFEMIRLVLMKKFGVQGVLLLRWLGERVWKSIFYQ